MGGTLVLIIIVVLALGCGLIAFFALARMLQVLHERQNAVEARLDAITYDLTVLKVLLKERVP